MILYTIYVICVTDLFILRENELSLPFHFSVIS